MSTLNGDSDMSFVEAVCFRPKMYTINGTFEEVVCFLHGFFTGMVAHNANQKVSAFTEREWFNFLQWHSIQEQYESSTNYTGFYHKALEVSRKNNQSPESYVREIYRKYREL